MSHSVDVRRAAVVPLRLKFSEHRLLLTAGDTLASAIAVVVALWLWSIPAGWTFSLHLIRTKLTWFAFVPLWIVAASLPANAVPIAFSLRRTMAALVRGAAILLVGYGAWYFYAPRGVLPRLVALYFLWEAILLTIAWRLVFLAVFTAPRFRRRAIVVGSGEAATAAIELVERYRARQSTIVATVSGDEPSRDPLLDSVSRLGVSEIFLAIGANPPDRLVTELLACQEAGAEIVRVQTLIEQLQRRVPVTLLEPDWLLTDLADATRLREASWWAKRALDVAGSAIGLLAGAALTPFIALAIRLDSGSPVFYRQQRLGRGGVPFVVVKFRTMKVDAERPGEARWADAHDERATRVGRFLRRIRLDELPQLLNVLRGEMSLVGPRPERPEFVERLQDAVPFYRARLMVPPGLTGWAQVNLPYGDSVDAARAKLEYDLYYVKHRSVLFDLAIIAKTFGALARLEGR